MAQTIVSAPPTFLPAQAGTEVPAGTLKRRAKGCATGGAALAPSSRLNHLALPEQFLRAAKIHPPIEMKRG